MTSAQIRRQFIDFFIQKHAHTFVPSSPVVPHDDPTLLFTNAGMNQFKPLFLGTGKAPYTRAVNTQKCIRAGGKHNDLDDVGRSRRHHTFFEMLGNWSFGDYFKQGAIEMAWELLTKVWGLDPTRLHVSCYEGNEAARIPRDTEAADIWKKVANWSQYGRSNDDHIHYFGKDNFWEMGDTGPCGPCTEIYIDRTPDKTGGPQVNGEDPRVMEIWNLVFIQYNRDAAGVLTPLPSQHVDTGMGLERICQVLQGKDDNYGTDLFTPLFEKLSQISGLKYTGTFPKTNFADPIAEAADPQLRHDIAFRVIADHIRCLTFALTDGATPSNEGRGYVLRRILRRAVRFGKQQLNLHEPFLHKLVPVVVETMGEMFPELRKNPARVIELVNEEEIGFGKTLDRGIELFEEATSLAASRANFIIETGLDAATHQQEPYNKLVHPKTGELGGPINPQSHSEIPTISAKAAFTLYDTFGFPLDLTRIMAEERGYKVDIEGYDMLMEEAKERSRAVDKTTATGIAELPPDALAKLAAQNIHATDDSAKFLHKPTRATIKAIWNGKNFDESLDADTQRPTEPIALILDRTSFYAEMGGQVGDTGEIRTDQNGHIFDVTATRAAGGYVLHIGHLKKGRITVGESVTASVLGDRESTMKHHTATHMANWALREVLGDGVQQKGSLVDPHKLRFDFSHGKPLAEDELARVETLVTDAIAKKLPVYTQEAPQEQALKIHGLRAVFGEKYPPMVRVVSVGAPVADLLADPANPKWRQFSIEFCGGTHLANSAEAEAFTITADESVSKGVRRMVAVTGTLAQAAADQAKIINSLIAQARTTPETSLPGLIAALQKAIAGDGLSLRTRRAAQAAISEAQDRHKKWQRAQSSITQDSNLKTQDFNPESLLAAAQSINGTTLITAAIPNASADVLRNTWDWLKKKHPQGNIAALLASAFTDHDKDGNPLPPKVNLLAAVSDPLIAKLKAGDWIKTAAALVGGSGGGRPQMAMAGGKDVEKIPEALEVGRNFAAEKLA